MIYSQDDGDIIEVLNTIDRDHAPTAEALRRIQHRMLTELDDGSDVLAFPLQEVDLHVLDYDDTIYAARRQTWKRALVSVAAAVVLLTIGGILFADDDPAIVDVAEEDVIDDSAPPLLDSSFTEIEAGSYRLITLGTELLFASDQPWRIQENDLGELRLVDPSDSTTTVTMMRPTWLNAPPLGEGKDGEFPLNSIELWLRDAEGIAVTGPTTRQVGGVDALVFDVFLEDSFRCGGSGCLDFVGNPANNVVSFVRSNNERYRIFWLLQGDLEPIVIIGTAIGEGANFEEMERLVNSLEVGDPRPHPFGERPWEVGASGTVVAGRTTLPLLNDVSFDLPYASQLTQAPGFASFAARNGGAVRLFTPRMTLALTPIETADQFVQTLVSGSTAQIRILDSVTVAGNTALLLELENDRVQSAPVLTQIGTRASPWQMPATGQAWVIESSNGLLVVSAEGSSGGLGSDVLELAPTIVESLRIEP